MRGGARANRFVILVHLADRDPPSLGALAGHLGLASSTLSEAVSRLEALALLAAACRSPARAASTASREGARRA